jgi:hypothetical protein
VRGGDPDASWPAAAPYGVRYLVVTPALLAGFPGATLAGLRQRPDIRLAHLTGDAAADFVAVFEIVPKGR